MKQCFQSNKQARPDRVMLPRNTACALHLSLHPQPPRNMQKTYLLAIDNGTQSVRALLFDLQGNLVDKAQVAITTGV